MKRKLLALLLCLTALLTACRQEPVEAEPESLPAADITEAAAPAETVQTLPAETEPEGEPADTDFVSVKAYIPNILVDLKYATSDNFLGKAVYEFQDMYLRYGTVVKLMAVQQELESMGLRLKIWDGFRPLSAQRALWEVCPDPNYVSNPETGTRSHCRGNTVDITLADAEGYGIEMPTGFDDFTALADRDYSDCTETAAENAKLLESVMEKYGFTGYTKEWWHYSDDTVYPVEECFDPAVISQWVANCNEYISLRTQPDTGAEVLVRISVGAKMTLLGYVGDFAMVDYEGQRGYVLSSYITPLDTSGTDTDDGNGISLNKPLYYADCQQFISLRTEADRNAEVITQIAAGEEFLVLEWHDDFALVDYNGLIGYVLSSYIKPV